MTLPKKHVRLMELLELLREGQLTDDHARELESILQSDPAAIEYYVEAIDVFTALGRQLGQSDPRDVVELACPLDGLAEPKSNRRRIAAIVLAPAVCASLVAGLLFGLWFASSGESVKDAPVEISEPDVTDIATLSRTAGCVWAPDEPFRYEGQRLSTGSLNLLKGVATIRFDSDAMLVVEGPAKLDMLAIDSALVRQGKVVFSGIEDIDAFTLRTPFSTIYDEGTEYGVSVDPSGESEEIHVFDGGVLRESALAADVSDPMSVRLAAGEARRFASSGVGEAISLSPSRFIRPDFAASDEPTAPLSVETFDYDKGSLVGQEKGAGFLGPWRIWPGSDWEQNSVVEPDGVIDWPGRAGPAPGGVLRFQGDTKVLRVLKTPVRLDRDGVYYVSFLLRKAPGNDGASKHGWAYVTLHGRGDNKIVIGLGGNGAPRLSHNTRGVNAAMTIVPEHSYLYVCKLVASRDGADQAFARIYRDDEPVDRIDPIAWNMATPPLASDEVLGDLRFCCRKSQSLLLDEVRVGRTWGSVTGGYSQ